MKTDVATTELLQLVTAALAPAGEPAASLVAHALIDAEVRGHTRFGLQLLAELPDGSRDELTDRLALADRQPIGGPSVEVDLAGKFAPTAVAALIEPAHRWAADSGVSLVRLLNIGRFGRLAPFVAAIAERGVIGVLTMSSRSFVAPYGGHDAVLGTNPFAIGVPTDGHPLVVDTATSAITAADWENAKDGLAEVPAGALVDAAGRPTTDAREAVAIAPRGGLLGTSLGIAVEALTAAATGLLSNPGGAPRGGVLLVIRPAPGAGLLGSELATRLVGAGGRLPGQPVAWPDAVGIDTALTRRLEKLSSLP